MKKAILYIIFIVLFGFNVFASQIVSQNSTVNIMKTCMINYALCSESASCNITLFHTKSSGIIYAEMDMNIINSGIMNYTFDETNQLGEKIPYIITCCDLGSCNTQEYELSIQNNFLDFQTCPNETFSIIFLIILLSVCMLIYWFGLKYKHAVLMIISSIGIITLSSTIYSCSSTFGTIFIILGIFMLLISLFYIKLK